MDFRKGKNNRCPVKGCDGGGKDKFGIYQHFCTRHPEAKIIVKQDGELQQCELCGMHTAKCKNIKSQKHVRT